MDGYESQKVSLGSRNNSSRIFPRKKVWIGKIGSLSMNGSDWVGILNIHTTLMIVNQLYFQLEFEKSAALSSTTPQQLHRSLSKMRWTQNQRLAFLFTQFYHHNLWLCYMQVTYRHCFGDVTPQYVNTVSLQHQQNWLNQTNVLYHIFHEVPVPVW